VSDPALRVLFATPAFWPATAFGGPIAMARELTGGLRRLGHDVEVVTTSLVDLRRRGELGTRTRTVDGVAVHYLATPVRYRWMGVTPTLPLQLRRLARPDIVHVFGYRDVVTTAVAVWARRLHIPYVLEPLGMFRPAFRKVRTKRVFDRLVARPVVDGAQLVIATSELERDEIVAGGVAADRVVVRPNGFPPLVHGPRNGRLRAQLGLGEGDPLVLSVGRITRKKGLDLLVDAMRDIPDARLAIVGPDDHDGTSALIERVRAADGLGDRIHVVPPLDEAVLPDVYAEADVFVLPSRGESFGMVAAEAAAAGTPSVVTDRCGVAELLGGRGALVVPCERGAIRDAIAGLLADGELRGRLGEGARQVAAELSWTEVVRRQETIYRAVLPR
jgi:glycosyltransferase involved in cell wall biosynthesis